MVIKNAVSMMTGASTWSFHDAAPYVYQNKTLFSSIAAPDHSGALPEASSAVAAWVGRASATTGIMIWPG
ncbi:hypothetical protein WMF18_03970 [Sorangium sp. So ce315]|uniref:hypothetical protein n=1 Tax=Sorangium sp. So ce315 TaxID=3133299 RepID=UPI003F63C431